MSGCGTENQEVEEAEEVVEKTKAKTKTGGREDAGATAGGAAEIGEPTLGL